MKITELFHDKVTAEILEIAQDRLLNGEPIAHRGLSGCDRARAKLALLIVRETNPEEVFSQEEAAILYGISSRTLPSRQKTGSTPRTLNMGK